jgi:hypothetical protein
MTAGIVDKKRLIFPGLAGLYEAFSPASYSFMRFATGAVLLPHGIQKIMLGSAVNLAPLIDKQMGVPYPLMWAYLAVLLSPSLRLASRLGFSRDWQRSFLQFIWGSSSFSSKRNSATSGPPEVMNTPYCGAC